MRNGLRNTQQLKGGEIIVDYLVKEGVSHVFGMCGHGNVGLLDALYDRRSEIDVISAFHESAAGFMADAYYRVCHRPAAVITSCGPGSANLPVALGSALMDSSAMLAITGNVPTNQFNRGPFQETGRHQQADFPNVLRHYVKRSYQATRPEQLPLMMRQAFATMLGGRPGPVHLDVPLNVFVEEADEAVPDPEAWRSGISTRVAAAPTDVERCLELLVSAERPVIVAGHGVEQDDASEALRALAEALSVPVAQTPLGKGAIDSRLELSLGETGRNGTHAANSATRNADVILAVGTRFDDRATSAWLPGYTYDIPPTKLIHVHIDITEIGRNYPPTLGIVADARTLLEQLDSAVRQRAEEDERFRPNHPPRQRWLHQIAGWKQEWSDHIQPRRESDAVPIRPERAIAELRAAFPDDGILLSDVGIHHNWIVQEWPTLAPRTLLQSWGFASMGFGVAGAIGAKLAAPDRPVAAIVGDGGFMLMPNAVATAVQHQLPIVWLIWNNGGYVSIRDVQRGYFGRGRELATSFENPWTEQPYVADFAAMARSMGADGVVVANPDELGASFSAALASGRPTVIDMKMDAEAAPPSTGSWDLPPLPHPEPGFPPR